MGAGLTFLSGATVVVGGIIGIAVSDLEPPTSLNDLVRPIVLFALVAAVPVAMAVAIFRYRLYDIDTLIKGAVVYGTTTAAIAATFFGGLVALQAV